MKTNITLLEKHVSDCMATGNVKTVASELRRGNLAGWICVENQHADELARMARIAGTLPRGKDTLRVAIDPDSGTIAAFLIPSPNFEIDFNEHLPDTDDANSFQDKDELISQKVHANLLSAHGIAEKLFAGSITTMEDLFAEIDESADETTVMEILSNSRSNAIELETKAGRVRLGGVGDFQDQLPSRETMIVKVSVRSIDDDARGIGAAGILITEVIKSSGSLMHTLFSGKRCKAHLRTSNNSRSLRMLDFARFHGAEPVLELQLCYLVRAKKFEIEVVAIENESDLVKLDKPVQTRLADF